MDGVVIEEALNEDNIPLLEVLIELDEACEHLLQTNHCLDSDGWVLVLNQSLYLVLLFIS